MKEKIILIGAGAWGTAIANVVAINGYNICAISDINEIAQEINKKNSHCALANIKLNKNLYSSTSLDEAKLADKIFIAVPSNAVKTVLEQLSKIGLKKNCGFIFATKGLEHSSLKFFHEVFDQIIPNKNCAILSGPNFAIEVAQKSLTVTNIAAKNEEFANQVIKILKNDFFKPFYSKEVLVSEISSVIKNIMAIACGISDGLNLGENTKAALVICGVEEIKTLAQALGEKNPNTENAAGFGDIFLTCSTSKSRNNSLGKALGEGKKYQDLAAKKTYEGALNAESIAKLAKKLKIKLNLCQAIDEILKNNYNQDKIKDKIINIIG